MPLHPVLAEAALVGVAPGPRQWNTPRHTDRVGWARARPCCILGALVATARHVVIRAFSRRLIAAGRPQKVALTACMRKLLTILNAVMRPNTTGQQLNRPTCT